MVLPTTATYLPLRTGKYEQTALVGRSRLSTAAVAFAIFIFGLFLGHSFWGNESPTHYSGIPFRSYHPSTSSSNYKPPPEPIPILTNLPSPATPTSPDRIPNILHYVYGLAPAPEPFAYSKYLAIRSALLTLRPNTTYFHYHTLPTGPWFDLLLPNLTLSYIPDISDISSSFTTSSGAHVQPIPIKHFAHKADIVRMQVLLAMGGTYLDVDTFVLRDFGAAGLRELGGLVMGVEAAPENLVGPGLGEWDGKGTPKGLCNAVMIAEKGSTFMKRWWDTYRSFQEREWAVHSVIKPWELARSFPNEITMLTYKAMFWPIWTPPHLAYVHEQNHYDFFASGQLTYHAWEHMADEQYLSKLTPATVREVDTSFNRMARRFVGDESVEREAEARFNSM